MQTKNKIILLLLLGLSAFFLITWYQNYDGSTLGKEITDGLIKFREEIKK
jgi:hypothetical protein